MSYDSFELSHLLHQLRQANQLPADLGAQHFVVEELNAATQSPNTQIRLRGSAEFPSLARPVKVSYDRRSFDHLIGGLHLPYYGDELLSSALMQTAFDEHSALALDSVLLHGLIDTPVPHRRQDFEHAFEVNATSLLWNTGGRGQFIPYDTRFLLDQRENVVGLDLSTAVLYQDTAARIPAVSENDPVALAFACGRNGLQTKSIGLGDNPRVFLTMTGYMEFEGGTYELPQDRLDDYYVLSGFVDSTMERTMVLEIVDGYQTTRTVAQLTVAPGQKTWSLLFTPLSDRIRVRLVTDEPGALVRVEDLEHITTPYFIQEYEPARPHLTFVDHQSYLRCSLNQYLTAQILAGLSSEGTLFFQHLPQTSSAAVYSHVLGGLYNSVTNLAQLSYSRLEGYVDFDVQTSTGQWDTTYRFPDARVQQDALHAVAVSWSRESLRYEGNGEAHAAASHPMSGAVGESLRFRVGGENNYPTLIRRALHIPVSLNTRQTQALARFALANG